MIALLAALALAVLLSLKPWAPASVAPQLNVGAGLGVGLDDAVALPLGRQLAVAPAHPAGASTQRFAGGAVKAGGGATTSAPGIAPARAVSVATDGGPPAGAPEQAAPESPPPSAPPAPTAVPVAVPPEPAAPPAVPDRVSELGSRHPGPSAAGLDEVGGAEREAGEIDEEEGVGGAEGEAECAPPFHLFLDDAWHELVLCRELSNGDGFYLLLDGEPIDVEAWLDSLRGDEGESSGAVVP